MGEVLNSHEALHTTENDYVSLNQEGNPLNFHISARVFVSRASEPWRSHRESPIGYATRLLAVGLLNGVNIKWLGRILRHFVATIERHYGNYIESDAAEQLPKMAGTVTPDKASMLP